MIVYGDAEFRLSWREALRRMEAQFRQTDSANLDGLRTFLVQAGQIEQAARDAGFEESVCEISERLTNAAAAAFVARWRRKEQERLKHVAALRACVAQLTRFSDADTEVTIKIPEGFEFYALFPEQYCCSAKRWSHEHHEKRGSVLVVGIRSIGTALSAVAAATLALEGWDVQRITIRPAGHPFQRTAEIPRGVRADYALIVDEGPGLSGSSITAVATALEQNGFATRAICFFPGSDRQPGEFASEATRDWWINAPRYFTPLDNVRWNGRTLEELLAEQTHKLTGSVVSRTDDLSGGQWRHFAFDDESQWPPVAPEFERMKFRCETHSGGAVLWKFTGFGCMDSEPAIAEQIEARARLGWTTAPRARRHGFTATPWVEGVPASRSDAGLLDQVARYIVEAAGPPLSALEAQAALGRLDHMLGHNLRELGFPPTEISPPAAEVLALPTYGDGRMAPHEWIVTSDDRLIKTDAYAHTRDHTIVGKQTVLWDVAGVIVEWQLSSGEREQFIGVLANLGLAVSERALEFYVKAYAVFRIGLLKMSRQPEDAINKYFECLSPTAPAHA